MGQREEHGWPCCWTVLVPHTRSATSLHNLRTLPGFALRSGRWVRSLGPSLLWGGFLLFLESVPPAPWFALSGVSSHEASRESSRAFSVHSSQQDAQLRGSHVSPSLARRASFCTTP